MKNILVAMPFGDNHKTYIEKIGADCKFHYTTIKTATAEEVKAADIIFGNISPELVKQNDHLEWMQLNSAGSDQYCKPGVIGPDTILTCATGAYGLSVSEHMVAMSMMLCRKMDLYMKNQVKHEWKEEGSVTSIWNSTTLVAGLGDIGSEYAKRMKALGSRVIGIRRNVVDKPDFIDEIYTMDQLDEVLPKVDFAVFILPSTPATHHIMDERRLRLMKPGSYLINAGRGDAVDCDALDMVLREGVSLAGCALERSRSRFRLTIRCGMRHAPSLPRTVPESSICRKPLSVSYALLGKTWRSTWQGRRTRCATRWMSRPVTGNSTAINRTLILDESNA